MVARCVLYRWRDIRNDSPLLGDVMSQGARTRVAIGSATPLKYRTARTMHEAFGEGATLERERSNAEKLDAFIGRFCTAIVVAAMLALVVNAAFGGI